MIDVLIITKENDPYLNRCLSSLPSDPRISLHTLYLSNNPTLIETPGSTYNVALQYCNNPIFTIIDSSDYYLSNIFEGFFEFLKYKSFGLIYADSINQRNGKLNPFSLLPNTDENMLGINPVRKPIFYNRKIVDYLLRFDNNSFMPEYDMTLKIWEKFPIVRYPVPMIVTKRTSVTDEDLDKVIYDHKIRVSKRFMFTGPNQYPFGLLDPII
jgi:hypothetical protein